jgi:hypothetical protein
MVTTLASGAPPVWSSPEFWVAVPAIVIALVFGAVTMAALARARQEDVPEVLSIFVAALTRHVVRRRGPASSLPSPGNFGAEPPPLPAPQTLADDGGASPEAGGTR